MKFIGHKFILGVGLAMIAMFGLLFFSPNSALASTEEVIHSNINSNQPINFTATTSGTLICSSVSYYTEGDHSFWLNNTNEGSNFTDILNDSSSGYEKHFIFYKQINSGENSLIILGDVNNGFTVSCVLDSDNLTYNSQKFSSSVNSSNSFYEDNLNGSLNSGQKLFLINYFHDNATNLRPLIYFNSMLETPVSINSFFEYRFFSNYLYSQIGNNVVIHNYSGANGNYMNSELVAYLFDPSTPPKTPLEMKTVEFEPLSGIVVITGTCSQYGSGINQMQVVGVADDATSTPPVYPDPWGIERGGLISCNDDDTFSAIYNGEGMTGSHYIAIDDTFFGTEWASIQVNFDATSTATWSKDAIYGTDDSQETAKKMACTDEEWASDNIITKTKCRVGQAVYIAIFSIRDKAKEYSTGLITTFKNTFPFNLSNFVKETWKKSETAELPNNLQFLNFSDSNGDINIPVKIGTATSTIPIFGKSIFQNDDSKDAYEKIRDVSTWVFRGLVIIYAFMIGIKIYHELNGSKHQE